MRCPHCRGRVMGLFDWVCFVFSQPTFGERYRATCKSCGARVRRRRREVVTGLAMLSLGAGAAIALSAPLPWPFRMFAAIGGLVAGVVAHYPIADYRLADPGSRPELPPARASDGDDGGAK